MQFLDSLPSDYGSHSTGGEHTQKHHDDPLYIDAIRDTVLPRSKRWDPEAVRGIMNGGYTEGVLVNTFYEGSSSTERSLGLIMVGGALVYSMFIDEDRKHRVVTIDASDIVVAPEHQRRGIGKYLLSTAITQVPFNQFNGSFPYPERVAITDNEKVIDTGGEKRLIDEGFKLDDAGQFSMLLAGRAFPFNNIDSPTEYKKMEARIPPWFNGHIVVVEAAHGRPSGTHIFRGGEYVGCVTKQRMTPEDDDSDSSSVNYEYYDASNDMVCISKQPWTEFYAASDLLNMQLGK